MKYTFTLAAAAALLFLNLPLLAQSPAQAATAQAPATDAMSRIRDEGMNRSQVMGTLSYLTDVIGPRLTGTPALKRANEWTRDELTKYGLQNAHLESWGPFGRGWTLTSFSAEMTQPQYRPLEAYPKAWSPSVDLKDAEVVWVNAKTEADLQQYKGKLKGKVVLSGAMKEVKAHFEAEATRHSDHDMLEMADAANSTDVPPGGIPPARNTEEFMKKRRDAMALAAARTRFYAQEGVALILDWSRAGDGGNIFVQQATVAMSADTTSAPPLYKPGTSPWDKSAPVVIPQLAVAVEQYNRMARMIEQGEKIKINLHLAVQYHAEDLNAYNTLAELPGTDKKDEVVMLGAHLDSWHGGTGATDNAAGCAVVMEAMRILKALNLQPRRTIRVALWGGEEQGLLGSRAYVKQHFGEVVEEKKDPKLAEAKTGSKPPAKVIVKPEWQKLAGYYNLDNGAGKIRGIYMQGNEAVRPIFRTWLAPFKDLGATTLTAQNTGGTDHLAFDAVGLPGFQFIQDELEYMSRTHHSTQDVFDRAIPDDMKQASVVMAAFIYQTAMRDEKLPRKPVQIVKGAKSGEKVTGM